MNFYKRVLAERFNALPQTIKEVHAFDGRQCLSGKADVRCNETKIGRILLRLLGLPRAGKEQKTRIRLEEEGQGERWHRSFGHDGFSSRVKLHRKKPGRIVETDG